MALALGGCASGDAKSSLFVEPAKYELYDCKQLSAVRKSSFARVTELQGLMAKAEQGVAGGLISGVAYQTEYLSARANLDLIEQTRQRNKCGEEVIVPDQSAPQQAVPKSRGKRS